MSKLTILLFAIFIIGLSFGFEEIKPFESEGNHGSRPKRQSMSINIDRIVGKELGPQIHNTCDLVFSRIRTNVLERVDKFLDMYGTKLQLQNVRY